MRKRRHQPSLPPVTYAALQRWAIYIQSRTGKPMSMAETIHWLATRELDINIKSGNI